MRSLYKFLGILLLASFTMLPSYGQEVSYKIIRNAAGCYEVYYKTTVAFNNTKISSAQVTVVAPKGTGALLTALTPAAGITFSTTSSGGNFEIFTPPASAGNVEYLIFGLNAFNATVGVDPLEFKLFSFCLTTSTCPGNLRLIQGLSPVSPWVPYDGRSGAADPTFTGFDPYNAMNVDNNGCVFVQTAGTCPNTIDLYKGTNYGLGLANCPIPDLTTSITPASSTGTLNTATSLTVNVNNIGAGPSSGSASETITIPSGITYNSGGGNGWVCVPASGPVTGPSTVVCTNPSPSLAATTGTSSFNLNVTPTVSGATLTIPAVVAGGGETNTTNNTTSANLVMSAVSDLTMSITPASSTGTVNTATTLTVNVNNIGSGASVGSASTNLTIPAGMTYNSAGGNGWVCVPASGPVTGPSTVTCTNPNPSLAATTGTSSFPMSVTPTVSNTTLTVPGTVSGGGETNTTNNTTSAVVIMGATPPDLTTNITPASSAGTINSPTTLTVNVANIGGSPSSGSVSETINIPAGETYVSGGGNGWTCVTSANVGPTTVLCTNPSPNIGSGGTSTFPMVVTPTTSGVITTGVAVSGGGEVNTSNNSGSANLTVGTGCLISAGVLQKN